MQSSGSSGGLFPKLVLWVQGNKASDILQTLLPRYKPSSSLGDYSEQAHHNHINQTMDSASLTAVYPEGATAEERPKCLDGTAALKIYGVKLHRRSYENKTSETYEKGSIGIWICPSEDNFQERHALGLAAQETFYHIIRNQYEVESAYCITKVCLQRETNQVWSWEDIDGLVYTLEVREICDAAPEADQGSERAKKDAKAKAKL